MAGLLDNLVSTLCGQASQLAESRETKPQVMSKRVVAHLGLLLVFSGALVIWFRGVISSVGGLYPQAVPDQPYFGIVGAAIATLLSELLWLTTTSYYFYRQGHKGALPIKWWKPMWSNVRNAMAVL